MFGGGGTVPGYVSAAGPVAATPVVIAAPVVMAPVVTYGGFWRRFVALIIDSLILYIVTAPLSLLFNVPMWALMRGDQPTTADLAALMGSMMGLAALSSLIHWLYFALMESSPKQATLGKMALNLRVTDQQGRRISFGRATGRFFAKIISGLTFLIGYLMAAFTERKRALHDMIAGTLVVKTSEGA
jgi:uncharacterized RDD family membrane protein YckC